ncbi:MAG: dihydrofolate reductase [Brumimicrobium sp.]|nr:dihydrofolate reductase [Brumimicrobium sp.]
MNYSIIVAIGENRGIGKNNDLLWHLPSDMRFFKETTKGHTVIMGRKNWESIPKQYRPLPDRVNIVLTRNKDYNAEGAIVVNSFEDLPEILTTEGKGKYFIIGGADIYNMALQSGLVNEMFITQVHENFGADVFFPFFEEKNWKVETVLKHPADDRNEYSFTIKHYRK